VALLLYEEGIPVVGVPKTIDNDLGGIGKVPYSGPYYVKSL
jgi:6-phosphofructokinase